MKKNTYLSILTVLTIICILAGLAYHVLSKGDFLYSLFSDSSKQDINSSEITLEEFDAIKIDADVANIEITEGSDFSIRYSIGSNVTLDYSVSDKVLTIKEKNTITLLNKSSKYYIKITVPEGKVLDELKIISDVGDININDIKITETEISADVGNINISDVTFENLTIQADVGDIEVKSNETLDDVDFVIETDIGDVKINNEKQGNKYNSRGTSDRSLKIIASVGNVDINY